MTGLRAFMRNTRAASAAEFALVLPVALLFLLGIIDVGRYSWQMNQIEKAAQMGVRYAVVTDIVEGGLATHDFKGNTSCGDALEAGDRICADALSKVVCTATTCQCTGTCPHTTDYNGDAFTNILGRVQAFAPAVGSGNMTVEYAGSGLGYAGDPQIAIAPVVTVRLTGLDFAAISLLGTSFDLPDIARSQTLEDGKGSASF